MSTHALIVACVVLCLAAVMLAAESMPASVPTTMPATLPAIVDHAPVFDIPRLENITIDGKADDWGDQGLKVDLMATLDGRVKSATNLDARFRLGWDQRGLLVLATVKDDYFIEDDGLDTLWMKDAVEIYLADKRGSKQLVQAVIAAGVDGAHNELRYKLIDHRKDEALKKVPMTLTAERTKIQGGYILEVLLPWENVGVKPVKGLEVGATIFVDAQPREGRQVNVLWYPGVGVFNDTTKTYSLRLSDKASEPIEAAARGGYVGMRSTRAVVVAVKELAGKKVAAQADGKEIAAGVLKEGRDLAGAELFAPFPPYGTEYKLLDILLDGKIIQSIPLPEVAAQRKNALRGIDVKLDQYVLTSSKLPGFKFDDDTEAANILGPHTVQVTFYDANHEVVTAADKPGVYAAIVEFVRQGDPSVKRYHTLLRIADGVDLAAIKLSPPQFPKELGIGEDIARQHADLLARLDGRLGSDTLGNSLTVMMEARFGAKASKPDPKRTQEQFADFLQRSADSAVTLGWLEQLQAGAVMYGRTNPLNWNLKFIQELRRKMGDPLHYEYYVHLPEGIDADKTKKWPLIISLHGSGGGDLGVEAQANTVPVKFLKAHPELPFILVAPASKVWWNLPALDDMYAEVLKKYPVDPDRVYLTGLSMGGYGSWQWIAERPDLFAAVVPVCGGGTPADAPLFKDVPTWAFHGAKDPAVPVQRSYDMVEALRAVHGRVRLTVYPNVLHDSWEKAYTTMELYQWMLRQVRGKPQQSPSTMTGTNPAEE